MIGSAQPPAILDIDLGAIVENWRTLRARHRSGPVAGVVKADGYGLGARPIVEALHAAGCRHFFTAHLAEALAIRDAAPGAMVAVLNGPLPGEEAIYAAEKIDPVLGSLGDIERWAAHARATGKKLPGLLHVDTGMARLGLDPREVLALQENRALLDGIDPRYVMTHLVSAELLTIR